MFGCLDLFGSFGTFWQILAHSTSSMSSHWVRQHFFLFQRFGDVPDAFVHCRDHPREGAPGRVVDSMQVRLHLDTPASPATWGGGKPNKSQHGHKSMSKYVKYLFSLLLIMNICVKILVTSANIRFTIGSKRKVGNKMPSPQRMSHWLSRNLGHAAHASFPVWSAHGVLVQPGLVILWNLPWRVNALPGLIKEQRLLGSHLKAPFLDATFWHTKSHEVTRSRRLRFSQGSTKYHAMHLLEHLEPVLFNCAVCFRSFSYLHIFWIANSHAAKSRMHCADRWSEELRLRGGWWST